MTNIPTGLLFGVQVTELPNGKFIDAFSGTGVVASSAVDSGWAIKINDMMKCSTIMSEARLLTQEDVPFSKQGGYEAVISKLNGLDGRPGIMWEKYSPASLERYGVERRYFTESNAKKIDAVCHTVHQWSIDGIINSREFSLLMADLFSAANDVANIAGTYGCFLSKWSSQALSSFSMKTRILRQERTNYEVSNLDVYKVSSNPEDTVYFDPPYTKRQYASYYHILETLAQNDEPIVEGVAGLRPWKDKASVFCYKAKALDALASLVLQQSALRVVISYSDEGHVCLDDLEKLLRPHGEIYIVEVGTISRYTPNKVALQKGNSVKEYD